MKLDLTIAMNCIYLCVAYLHEMMYEHMFLCLGKCKFEVSASVCGLFDVSHCFLCKFFMKYLPFLPEFWSVWRKAAVVDATLCRGALTECNVVDTRVTRL